MAVGQQGYIALQPRCAIACISPGASISKTVVDVSLHMNAVGQLQSWAITGGGTLQKLNVKCLQKGDRLSQTVDPRVATEHYFLAVDRGGYVC